MIIKYLFYKTLGHFKVFLRLLPRSPHELYEFMNDKFDSLWSFLISLGCPMILILLLVRYLHKILSFCVRKVMFMFLRRSPQAPLSGVFARKACRKIGFSICWSNLKSSRAWRVSRPRGFFSYAIIAEFLKVLENSVSINFEMFYFW